MSRPSHAMQQQELDEALAASRPPKWGWLFTPDPKWLAAVNTTTLREVNAVRMFVLVTVLWNGLGTLVTSFALGRCYMMLGTLGDKETVATVRLLCEESLATHRMLDFAAGVFNSYGILLGAMAGIAVGAMWAKRVTDTPHRVAVEEAKKAPVIMPVTTAEPPVQPTQQTTVNVGDDSVKVNGQAVPAKPKGGDGPGDDERAD